MTVFGPMKIPRIMAISRIDSPFKLAGAYAVLGALWIVVSDGLKAWRAGEGLSEWLTDATKGLGFVVVTAILLYVLTRRLIGRHQAAEAALRDSQQRLALTLEAANQGLYDFNVQTGEVIVNDTFATMLGHDPADFRIDRDRWLDLLHPEDREQAVQELADYLEGRTKDYRLEFRMKTAAGDWRWMLSVGRVVERDPAGRPLRMLGTHTDITDRKYSEARTADTLAFAKTVLHSSPMGVIAYGPDGQAVIANQSAADMVGTNVPGLLRQNFRKLESWRRCGLLAAAEQALATDQEVVHNASLHTTFGRSLQVEAYLVPFDFQGGRHLLLMMGDETAKRLAMDNLHLLHAALQAAPSAWIITDAEGAIEWVNPAFTRMTGYTAAETAGQTTRLLRSGRHLPEFYRQMWETIRRGEIWSGEICNRRKDGTLYDEHMTVAPVRDGEGAIRHFVAIKEDVTGQKTLEQQLARVQRLESIGMLASGIAHDLNNIFAPILLSLELLKLKYPSADAHKTLEMIEKAGQRGAGIVRQLLTFARGIDGERTEVQVRYLVKEAAQILGETLPRNIQVETEIAPDLPSVLGDATQLHQVLLNLAINARDAMPEGGVVSIGAQLETLDEARAARNLPLKPGPCVALTVIDTGTGILPEVLDHMFEPFFTTKPLGKGTGLGLSTVYGIVRGHGGAVEVSTSPGKGTRFTILLPALDRRQERRDSRPPMAGPISGAGRRILVVDDEEPIRLITLHALERHDFMVEAAVDGVEALAIFRKDPARFAVVLTDLMMPRMNGRELVQEIRRLAPTLPIIASSGLSEENSSAGPVESLASLGVRILLRKPYTEAELLAALRQELEPGAPAEKSS